MDGIKRRTAKNFELRTKTEVWHDILNYFNNPTVTL